MARLRQSVRPACSPSSTPSLRWYRTTARCSGTRRSSRRARSTRLCASCSAIRPAPCRCCCSPNCPMAATCCRPSNSPRRCSAWASASCSGTPIPLRSPMPWAVTRGVCSSVRLVPTCPDSHSNRIRSSTRSYSLVLWPFPANAGGWYSASQKCRCSVRSRIRPSWRRSAISGHRPTASARTPRRPSRLPSPVWKWTRASSSRSSDSTKTPSAPPRVSFPAPANAWSSPANCWKPSGPRPVLSARRWPPTRNASRSPSRPATPRNRCSKPSSARRRCTLTRSACCRRPSRRPANHRSPTPIPRGRI